MKISVECALPQIKTYARTIPVVKNIVRSHVAYVVILVKKSDLSLTWMNYLRCFSILISNTLDNIDTIALLRMEKRRSRR